MSNPLFDPWSRRTLASNGQQVLFYLQHDDKHKDCQVLRCVSRMQKEGYDVFIDIDGIPNDVAQEALNRCSDGAFADRAIGAYSLSLAGKFKKSLVNKKRSK